MLKQRLDQAMAERKLVSSRSQAESYVRLGQVKINGKLATKSGMMVSETDEIEVKAGEQYVGRAALKLQSAAGVFKLDFVGKTVLDVGSSTGGFTQFALLRGAAKVYAVEVGKDQLHPSLRSDPRIELYEQTDIRNVRLNQPNERETTNDEDGQVATLNSPFVILPSAPDMVVADVSFISLRELLPHISTLVTRNSELVMMVKPQFEAGQSNLKHKGVIKNDKIRREILKDFEVWARQRFKIINQADSQVPGSKGNVERFYLLKKLTDNKK